MNSSDWAATQGAAAADFARSAWALAVAWPIPTIATAVLIVAVLAALFIRSRAPAAGPSPNRQADQLARIQRLRGSRVIAIIHRETHPGGIAFGGAERSFIDLNDFEGVVAAISATSDSRPLDII